jgi:arylsulfatase A-like enzyme
MSGIRHILFIMCDQLRWDYLGCYGHPHLATPNVDGLAAAGVRFEHAYVQSPICGPSRMSFYTGRYMSSHGATWNGFPLKVGELTLGDYLRPLGWRTVLAGKTHMRPDVEGMARLGIDPRSVIGVHVSECGFEPFERDDGLHPDGRYYGADPAYDDYLRRHGFHGRNPWHEWANSGIDPETGALRSGWFLENAELPARVPEEHSETPYMTRRAMEFMRTAGDEPWCLHLSYIKPHWPYVVPAPYHEMYGRQHFLPAVRSERERLNTHPVYRAFMDHRDSRAFSRDEVRERVLPAYMGLIKQIDDQLGVLLAFLREEGLWDDTLIVFTSDHGDYLGDHWLGEKDLFHDCAVRVPLIVRDPRPEAQATRGTVSATLIEAVDLAPTFLDYAGGAPVPHRLEGRSLRPLIEGESTPWRDAVVSECDYSMRDAGRALGVAPIEARIWMVRTRRWKYIYYEGFPPQLFDLAHDPDELEDVGCDPALAGVRDEMKERLFRWSRSLRSRTTVSEEAIRASHEREDDSGIRIGWWNEEG